MYASVETGRGFNLQVVRVEPLFGHKSGKNSKTQWMCFMKINNP